jgi:hypothetical protein
VRFCKQHRIKDKHVYLASKVLGLKPYYYDTRPQVTLL